MEKGFYDGTYKAMFYDKGKATYATKLIHKALERYPSKNGLSYPVTLEVGGGEGLHFQYVKPIYERYVLSDIRIQNFHRQLKSHEIQVSWNSHSRTHKH